MKRSHSLFQSFAEMALRNDEARFSVECVLPESQTADEAALLTGWIHTFVQLLHGYEELLSCEWENRTFMRDLDRVLISYGQSLPPYLHGPVTMDPSTANAADFSSYIREYKALLEHREQH